MYISFSCYREIYNSYTFFSSNAISHDFVKHSLRIDLKNLINLLYSKSLDTREISFSKCSNQCCFLVHYAHLVTEVNFEDGADTRENFTRKLASLFLDSLSIRIFEYKSVVSFMKICTSWNIYLRLIPLLTGCYTKKYLLPIYSMKFHFRNLFRLSVEDNYCLKFMIKIYD